MTTRSKLISTAERLVLYARRVQTALQSTERYRHQDALADVAETHEIARRLYKALSAYLEPPPDATTVTTTIDR